MQSAAQAPHFDLRSVRPDEHFVQFYEREGSLLDSVAEFIGRGLSDSASALVLATDVHREELEGRLRSRGFDIDSARQTGRYVPCDARETLEALLVDGSPDPQRFNDVVEPLVVAAGKAASRLIIAGEMVSLVRREGKHSAAVRLEEFWNELSMRHTFALFCAYPMFDGVVTSTDAIERVLGYTSGEYVGHHIAEFYADTDAAAGILTRLRKGETLGDEPARMRHKNGSLRDVLVISNVRWDDGSSSRRVASRAT